LISIEGRRCGGGGGGGGGVAVEKPRGLGGGDWMVSTGRRAKNSFENGCRQASKRGDR